MQRLLLLIVVPFVFFWSLPVFGNEMRKDFHNCQKISGNKLLMMIFQKTIDSEFVSYESELCNILSNFANDNPDNLILTTKRKGRSQTICLKREKESTCRSHLAIVNSDIPAAEALRYTYTAEIPQPEIQKETVERLFLKPSSLIQ